MLVFGRFLFVPTAQDAVFVLRGEALLELSRREDSPSLQPEIMEQALRMDGAELTERTQASLSRVLSPIGIKSKGWRFGRPRYRCEGRR